MLILELIFYRHATSVPLRGSLDDISARKTLSSSTVDEAAFPKRSRQSSNKNVAAELVEVARDIASQIKPTKTSQSNCSTSSYFGQYVAERLQEMDPEMRSRKRREIVMLLED